MQVSGESTNSEINSIPLEAHREENKEIAKRIISLMDKTGRSAYYIGEKDAREIYIESMDESWGLSHKESRFVPKEFKLPAVRITIPAKDYDDEVVYTKHGRLPRHLVDINNKSWLVDYTYYFNLQGKAFIYSELLGGENISSVEDEYASVQRIDFAISEDDSSIIPLTPDDYELVTDTLDKIDKGEYQES